MSATPVTRQLGMSGGAELLAVRRAVLKVARGSGRGRSIELGERGSVLIGSDPDCDLVLADDSVSRRHAELRVARDGYHLRDLGSMNGTRVGGLRVREAIIERPKTIISIGESELVFTIGKAESEHRLSVRERFGLLIGKSDAMRELFALLERVAPTDSTVLIVGESGTGKERVAETIHAQSPRSGGPFIVVDCSSIPQELAESELFGHARGAFTGADVARPGAFREADGGVLFLDEIGELPLQLQATLLRAIERKQVKPVGASHYDDVDIRIVAAAQRDLGRAVKAGTFRADLFYRLAVVTAKVPPLRQRTEDIPALVNDIVEQLRPDTPAARLLSPAVMAALGAYDWPGNVRELRNALEHWLVVGKLELPERADGAAPAYQDARREAIDSFEIAYCNRLLAQAGGVAARAATMAGMSRQLFHHLLRKHGLDGGDR